MQIEKIVCDRCGKEIVYDPIIQVHFPIFYIQRTAAFGDSRRIDLCRSCSMELNNWISNGPTVSGEGDWTIKYESCPNCGTKIKGAEDGK